MKNFIKKNNKKHSLTYPNNYSAGRLPKSTTGFTLVETIVAIFIFSILTIGIATLSDMVFNGSRDKLSSIDNIDHARILAKNFINEIRTASFGNDGGFPLNQADNSQITFYSNYGQNSGSGVFAKIRYYLVDNTLYKGVIIPSGSPLIYDPNQEKITVAQDNITNTNKPIFYYYDGDYAGSSSTSALTQPVNKNQVKYILISMDILKENSSLSEDNFTVSAGASIRNLKTNLGD